MDFGREMMGSGGQRVIEFGGQHHGSLGILCMVLGLILWALVVTTLVLLIIKLVRHIRTPGSSTAVSPVATAAPGALKILEERYARGEIDQADYLARKKDLAGLS
jgi:putative membrane protein